jgi:hypothetical protein
VAGAAEEVAEHYVRGAQFTLAGWEGSMTIIGNGRRYTQFRYSNEKDFEEEVVGSSKMLFGKNTIYINAKKRIDSKSLGGTVPDGFFFDFGDSSDPQFYMVEVELSGHSFYSHVFPQITKFFAFFNNARLQISEAAVLCRGVGWPSSEWRPTMRAAFALAGLVRAGLTAAECADTDLPNPSEFNLSGSG